MGFLRKRGPKPAEIPQYTGLQIQTSSNAVPIPILYGVNKLAPNLLWTGEFGSIPQYTKTGGKGGGRRTLSGYKYYTALTLGLCEGPIASIGLVWQNRSTNSAWGLNCWIRYGGVPDPYNAYSQDIKYPGVACVESAYFDLGESASLGSLQFEVYGPLDGSSGVTWNDADPAQFIYDFLTNAQYGVGFPSGSIDATSLFGASGGASYQAYCRASGVAMSPILANRESANAILTRWLQLTNSTAIWSEGKLKFLPYGDEAIYSGLVGGASANYVPDVTPLYDLTDDDFVTDGPDEDPVLVERKDESAIYNWQQVEISDVLYGYNSATITAWDQESIERFGRRDGSTIAAHEITDKSVGQRVAQLVLQRGVYIRNTYSFRLSFAFCLLEPMDIVTLTDAALGLVQAAVRIISIEEDEGGVLSVVAEEFPGSTGSAVTYPVQGNDAINLDFSVIPSSVNPPLIFEPPSGLTGGERQIWLAVSGGLATTFALEETAATGEHLAAWTFPSRAAGSIVAMSAYVKADARSAVQLGLHDGVAYQVSSVDLATGSVYSSSSGIIAASIIPKGSGWYLVSIECEMAATAAVTAAINIQVLPGSSSYAGTAGSGIFVWNPEFGWSGGAGSTEAVPLSVIALAPALTNATWTADGLDPPLGVEGTGDPYWGGCLVHVSTDDATYGQIGQVNGPARHGKITGDTGSVLSVDLVQSRGTLDPASASDAANAITLSLAGDELLAYGGALLTGTNAYDLSDLARGLYGTANVTHSAGERFVRLDSALFKYTFPAAYVGHTLYLKFQSFNVFGQALQDLSTCATYTYTPSGAGAGLGSILSLLAAGVDVDLGEAGEPIEVEEDLGEAEATGLIGVDLGEA